MRTPVGRFPICIMMDPDLKEWIDKEADKRRWSVSQIIRDLISKEKQRIETEGSK